MRQRAQKVKKNIKKKMYSTTTTKHQAAGNHCMHLIQGHNIIKENLTARSAAVHLQCHRNMLEKNMADYKI